MSQYKGTHLSLHLLLSPHSYPPCVFVFKTLSHSSDNNNIFLFYELQFSLLYLLNIFLASSMNS